VNDNPQPGSPELARRVLLEALAAERLRIVATLIRTTGDWDLAEDAVADATERALHRWPLDGIPDNPSAWLTTTARRRAIDLLRRAAAERNKLAELAVAELREDPEPGTDVTFLHDDRLRLIFTCAHPALPLEGRVALTLKVVAGLSTEAIAQAFLTTEATMGQRLLRAKRKITHAGIPYQVPAASALPERLDGVLAVVYLIFTYGYSRSASDVTEEAIRLGRLLVDLMPDNDETRSLLRLMLLQHARRHARIVRGDLVTLEDQDRFRWDSSMIAEALTITQLPGHRRGPYRVQADLAAVHATARSAADTDWPRIVRLYDELLQLLPSPVVALNRAIAVGMADGPLDGLAALDNLRSEPKLSGYHLLHAARADLLARAGLTGEALLAIDQAIALAPTDSERRQLSRRQAELNPHHDAEDPTP
jgi:RNA polymerase sigma-70 factor, ECF subfamily